MPEGMITQFMEMVRIDSESGNEAKFIEYLKGEFEKIGAAAEKDNYGNLIAKLPPKGSNVNEPILLSCHADTVKPGTGIKPVLDDGIIKSSGNTILGADDKAGIAEMLEALRIAEVRPAIEIAISRQEEVGLIGIRLARVMASRTRMKIAAGNANQIIAVILECVCSLSCGY
ncbi:MAG: M28 family peptidase [Candidatus Bathyarchaeota archaeon]